MHHGGLERGDEPGPAAQQRERAREHDHAAHARPEVARRRGGNDEQGEHEQVAEHLRAGDHRHREREVEDEIGLQRREPAGARAGRVEGPVQLGTAGCPHHRRGQGRGGPDRPQLLVTHGEDLSEQQRLQLTGVPACGDDDDADAERGGEHDGDGGVRPPHPRGDEGEDDRGESTCDERAEQGAVASPGRTDASPGNTA